VIFIAVILVMAAIAELTSIESQYKPAITLRNVIIALIFSFIFSVSNKILYNKNINFSGRIALHCLCLTADFIVVFILFGGYYKTGTGSPMAIIAIFVVFYLLIAAIFAIIRFAIKRNKINNSNYKRQF